MRWVPLGRGGGDGEIQSISADILLSTQNLISMISHSPGGCQRAGGPGDVDTPCRLAVGRDASLSSPGLWWVDCPAAPAQAVKERQMRAALKAQEKLLATAQAQAAAAAAAGRGGGVALDHSLRMPLVRCDAPRRA
jgi:hypothetical protein